MFLKVLNSFFSLNNFVNSTTKTQSNCDWILFNYNTIPSIKNGDYMELLALGKRIVCLWRNLDVDFVWIYIYIKDLFFVVFKTVLRFLKDVVCLALNWFLGVQLDFQTFKENINILNKKNILKNILSSLFQINQKTYQIHPSNLLK